MEEIDSNSVKRSNAASCTGSYVMVGEIAEPETGAYAESREADENGFVIDEDEVLTSYKGNAENVVIPESVTSMGEGVFTEKTSSVAETFAKENNIKPELFTA